MTSCGWQIRWIPCVCVKCGRRDCPETFIGFMWLVPSDLQTAYGLARKGLLGFRVCLN
jgi:hypothetical protein